MIKRIRQNYHWVVAFLVFAQMIVFGGLLNSASVYIIPISEALGVTRGSYSLATVPYSLTCTLSTMVSGYLFQKFGYKKSAIASLILITVSLVLTATCRTIWGFCFSKILMGLGYGVCFTAGAVRIVKDWFFKHQGLVVDLVSMSSGLGGSFLLKFVGKGSLFGIPFPVILFVAVFALFTLISSVSYPDSYISYFEYEEYMHDINSLAAQSAYRVVERYEKIRDCSFSIVITLKKNSDVINKLDLKKNNKIIFIDEDILSTRFEYNYPCILAEKNIIETTKKFRKFKLYSGEKTYYKFFEYIGEKNG